MEKEVLINMVDAFIESEKQDEKAEKTINHYQHVVN